MQQIIIEIYLYTMNIEFWVNQTGLLGSIPSAHSFFMHIISLLNIQFRQQIKDLRQQFSITKSNLVVIAQS